MPASMDPSASRAASAPASGPPWGVGVGTCSCSLGSMNMQAVNAIAGDTRNGSSKAKKRVGVVIALSFRERGVECFMIHHAIERAEGETCVELKQTDLALDRVAIGILVGSNGELDVQVSNDEVVTAKHNDVQIARIVVKPNEAGEGRPFIDMGDVHINWLPVITEHIVIAFGTHISELLGRSTAITMIRGKRCDDVFVASICDNYLLQYATLMGRVDDPDVNAPPPRGCNARTQAERIERGTHHVRGFMEQAGRMAKQLDERIRTRFKSDRVLMGTESFAWFLRAMGIVPWQRNKTGKKVQA